jgi:hypothetical protein
MSILDIEPETEILPLGDTNMFIPLPIKGIDEARPRLLDMLERSCALYTEELLLQSTMEAYNRSFSDATFTGMIYPGQFGVIRMTLHIFKRPPMINWRFNTWYPPHELIIPSVIIRRMQPVNLNGDTVPEFDPSKDEIHMCAPFIHIGSPILRNTAGNWDKCSYFLIYDTEGLDDDDEREIYGETWQHLPLLDLCAYLRISELRRGFSDAEAESAAIRLYLRGKNDRYRPKIHRY